MSWICAILLDNISTTLQEKMFVHSYAVIYIHTARLNYQWNTITTKRKEMHTTTHTNSAHNNPGTSLN